MNAPAFSILDHYPYMDTHPEMIEAWLGCIAWASGHPQIVADFSRDTGIKYIAPTSVIDRMIDEQSGRDAYVVGAFVDWFNANVWGDPDAPDEDEAEAQNA